MESLFDSLLFLFKLALFSFYEVFQFVIPFLVLLCDEHFLSEFGFVDADQLPVLFPTFIRCVSFKRAFLPGKVEPR